MIVGAGLGFVAAPTLIAAQSTVGWAERGVVTATSMFSRSVGGAVGVALFGAIANASLGSGHHTVPTLARASHHVFVGAVVAAVLIGLAVAMMPRTAHEPVALPAPDAAGA